MIKVGDIVRLDPNFDHPDIRSLRRDDPDVFEAEGEITYVENVYKQFIGIDGSPETIPVRKQVKVDWDDGEGTGTYPTEWLINIQQFKPEQDNPNRTFKSEKFRLNVGKIAEDLDTSSFDFDTPASIKIFLKETFGSND